MSPQFLSSVSHLLGKGCQVDVYQGTGSAVGFLSPWSLCPDKVGWSVVGSFHSLKGLWSTLSLATTDVSGSGQK